MKIFTKVSLIAFVAVIGWGYWADSKDRGPSEPTYPPGASADQKTGILVAHKIKRSNRGFVDVKDDRGNLTVVYDAASVWDGESWTKNALMAAVTVLKTVHEIAPGRYHGITVQVKVAVSSPGGKSEYVNGMLLVYNGADFKGVDWSLFTYYDAGSFPRDISFRKFGLESAQEFCQVKRNVENIPKFCNRVEIESS